VKDSLAHSLIQQVIFIGKELWKPPASIGHTSMPEQQVRQVLSEIITTELEKGS
jgi:hypothetical protein